MMRRGRRFSFLKTRSLATTRVTMRDYQLSRSPHFPRRRSFALLPLFNSLFCFLSILPQNIFGVFGEGLVPGITLHCGLCGEIY